jgi:outer membrane immunogenic protein
MYRDSTKSLARPASVLDPIGAKRSISLPGGRACNPCRLVFAFLTSLCVSAGIGLPASAADLYTKAPPAPPPLSTWTGFYAGANVGYGWGPWDATSNQKIFDFQSTTASPQLNGALGGIQIGYNYQVNTQWLLGLEADVQITGQKKTQNWGDPGLPVQQPPPPNPCDNICPADFVPRRGGAASLSSEWDLPWFGTVRARAGYLAAPNWLLYGTGGLAFGEAGYKFNFSQPGAAGVPAPTNFSLSNNTTKLGYAVGGGVETKLDRNWSVKFEYLFVDLGTVSINTTDIDGFPFNVNHHVRDNIARVGLNYSFK